MNNQFSMAQYSTLSDSEIKKILANYNIHTFHSWKVLSGGSENTNFYIESSAGEFVLTVCEQKSKDKAAELANLLNHLETHGFSTSKIFNNKDEESITLWNDKPLMLKEYLPGEVTANLSDHLLNLIGEELGKLHQIEAPDYLPNHFSYGQEYFSEIETYAPDSPFHHWLNRTHQYILEHISEGLPKALIHGDVFYNNVIISDDKRQAIIMDFEEACHYYRVFDIGMIIIGICSRGTQIELDKVHHLLKGYQRQIQLQPAERNALKAFAVYAAAATSFWRYRQFHFVQPDPALHNHYLTMKNLADHVKNLPDDCFFVPTQ